MNSVVERHDIDFVVDDFRSRVNSQEKEGVLRVLGGNPSFLLRKVDSAYGIARQGLLVDPHVDRLETWEAWVFAMQVTSAVFQISEVAEGEEVVLHIDRQDRRIKVDNRVRGGGPREWEIAFYLSLTCRDDDRVRALCRIPGDRLREAANQGGSEYLEFTYAWIDTLQSFAGGDTGVAEKLHRVMELCDPVMVPFGADNVAFVSFPQVEVFRRLLMGDSDEFVKSLLWAVEKFKLFYEGRTVSRKLEGVIPLGLLALACLGYEKFRREDPNFVIGIDSEYLPRGIVENRWHGEFSV